MQHGYTAQPCAMPGHNCPCHIQHVSQVESICSTPKKKPKIRVPRHSWIAVSTGVAGRKPRGTNRRPPRKKSDQRKLLRMRWNLRKPTKRNVQNFKGEPTLSHKYPRLAVKRHEFFETQKETRIWTIIICFLIIISCWGELVSAPF